MSNSIEEGGGFFYPGGMRWLLMGRIGPIKNLREDSTFGKCLRCLLSCGRRANAVAGLRCGEIFGRGGGLITGTCGYVEFSAGAFGFRYGGLWCFFGFTSAEEK